MKLTCIIVFVAITSSLNACPPGTIPGPNPQICYKFINDSLTWLGADQECISQEGNGVRLTSVENAILNQFLLNGAVNAFGTSDRFWLGSTTLLDGSTWSWSDGSNSDYTNWAPGEPKNTNGSYCVSSSVQRGGKWFSESCLSKHPYICEFLFSEVQENNCPDQWTYFSYTDKCYRFVTDEEIDDSFNFNSGREKCKSFDSNADLTIIRDFNENTLVSGLSINGIIDSGLIHKGVCGKDNIVTDCCVMIGLSKVNFTWQWVDGTNANYTNWLPGEPDSNAPYVNLLVGVQPENQWQSGYGCKNIMCQLNPAVINSSQNLKRSSFAKIF